MQECELVRMERLSREVDRSKCVRSVNVAPLADERVPAQTRLQANLVPLSGLEPDFEESRRLKRLERLVAAHRVLATRVSRVGLLLNQRFLVPDQAIAPH